MICKEKKSELTMLKIIMYKVSLLTAIIPQSFSFSFSPFKLLNLKIKILLIVFFFFLLQSYRTRLVCSDSGHG